MGDDLDLDALEQVAEAAKELEWGNVKGTRRLAQELKGLRPDIPSSDIESFRKMDAALNFLELANPTDVVELVRRLRATTAALLESRANDRAAMGWLADARAAAGDNGKRMLPEFVVYLKELRAKAGMLSEIKSWGTNSEGETVSDFREGQWWVKELDAIFASPDASPDQKRAVAVVHNLLRKVRELEAAAESRPASLEQWMPIETAPHDEVLLLASEFDGPGDWRIKCGYFDNDRGCWKVWGASWVPTRWAAIPAPPGSA